MLTAYLKGVAAVSAAGMLLFGAGSVARADLGAPAPPQVVPPSGSGGLGSSSTAPSQQQPQPQKSTPERVTRHDEVVTSPAPPSSATANVLNIHPLDTCVSCTSANAGFHKAHAGAKAIRLLGNDISAGDSSDNNKSSGALIAVPASPLLYLAIADWETATAAGPTSTSHSRASLVDLVIGPSGTAGHSTGVPGGAISVAILEATSNAGYQGLSSNGSGANNGVHINIGQGALDIIVLHSDASSDNKGSAYVLGINGAQLLSSDQTGGSGIPIAVPGVVGIVLLQVGAAGGSGSQSGGTSAAVGTVSDLLGQSGQAVGVLTASAVGLAGLQATPNAGAPPATAQAPAAAAAAGAKGLKAPNTGTMLGLGGLLLLASGAGLAGLSVFRRRDETEV
jgi:hypothetical protein